MKWKIGIEPVPEYGDRLLKVIAKSENNEVVVCVESLDNKLVGQLVKAHNDSLSEVYEKRTKSWNTD